MNWKKPLWMLLIATLILSMTMISVDSAQLPKLYVDPPKYTATQLGEVFTIDINIANIQDLKDFELKLGYNTTLLDALEAISHTFYAPISSWITELHEPEGYVWFVVNFSRAGGGNGTLAKVTFNATYAGSASCTLDLYETVLHDSNGDPITHDVEDGNYEFTMLNITVATDKLTYTPEENVQIHGNLTLGGSPHQGLIALEVDDQWNYGIVRRALQIGPTPPPGEIAIIDVIPCNSWGDPQENFSRGTLAYFKVTVGNNGTEWKEVAVTVNAYDGNMVSLGAPTDYATIGPGISTFIACIYIRSWAYIGTGTAYASVFTDLIRDGGVPYCPEESATFQITGGGGGGGGPLETLGSDNNSTSGNYNLTFKLAPTAMAGIYRVYASACYQTQFAMDNTVFGVNAICVPNDYPTIQEAINAANSTYYAILVLPEIYNENIFINKTLTLAVKDPRNTIINGSGTGTVVTVTANNVEISGFIIQNGGNTFPDSGITLNNSSDCTISENTILENYNGIYLNCSSERNTIQGNTITSNDGYGIITRSSNNNQILRNTVLNNSYGIYLNHSSSVTLEDNNIVGNKYNIGIFGDSLSNFIHVIDTSNTVDGKPIYYWVGQKNKQIPTDAGFVGIVNCSNITVGDSTLINNGQGVLFAFTNKSLIEGGVNTTSNEYGIYLVHSDRNTIIGTGVLNNSVGIYLTYSDENTICHNNISNNTQQVYNYSSANTWNDSFGKGNYWSDYTGVDDGSGNRTAGDDVGDTLLPHQGVDSYPLMNPWIAVHDVAITSVTPVLPYNASHLYPGWVINVTVTIKNEGDFTETSLNIITYYDGNPIDPTKTLPELTPQRETTINFTWNTMGVSPGTNGTNYTIKAVASAVPGETEENLPDNTLTDGMVQVNLIGDVNGDGKVTGLDQIWVGYTLFTQPWDLRWNPHADVSGDGKITGIDQILVGMHLFEGG